MLIPSQPIFCFAVVSRLRHLFLVSLSSVTWNSIYLLAPSDYSRLCLQKCRLIFFPYRPRLTSMQHTTSHTTAAQSPSHNQLHILIAKQWYYTNCLNLFHPVSILAFTAAYPSPSTLKHVTHMAKLIHLL